MVSLKITYRLTSLSISHDAVKVLLVLHVGERSTAKSGGLLPTSSAHRVRPGRIVASAFAFQDLTGFVLLLLFQARSQLVLLVHGGLEELLPARRVHPVRLFTFSSQANRLIQLFLQRMIIDGKLEAWEHSLLLLSCAQNGQNHALRPVRVALGFLGIRSLDAVAGQLLRGLLPRREQRRLSFKNHVVECCLALDNVLNRRLHV